MLNVLLVDDSEFIVQRLGLLLDGLLHVKEVRTANSAEDASLVMKTYEPHIVVLDMNLPGKNGLQLLKDIRKMEHIDPVIIVLTNNTLSRYKSECMEHGADYFLDKAKDFISIPSIIEKVGSAFFSRKTGEM